MSKFLAWQARGTDKDQGYRDIAENFRDARSVFRLTKSIFEVKRIKMISQKTNDKFAKYVNIISRACYFMFWLLDNVRG